MSLHRSFLIFYIRFDSYNVILILVFSYSNRFFLALISPLILVFYTLHDIDQTEINQ